MHVWQRGCRTCSEAVKQHTHTIVCRPNTAAAIVCVCVCGCVCGGGRVVGWVGGWVGEYITAQVQCNKKQVVVSHSLALVCCYVKQMTIYCICR